MSTATSVMGYGYDRWCVYPDVKLHMADGTVRYRWQARFIPVFARSAVRAAFRAQEDAERLARILTERNEPFA